MKTIRDDDWWVNTFAPLGPWKFNPMFPCWSKQINIVSLMDRNKLSVSEYWSVNKINKWQRARARSSYLCSFVSTKSVPLLTRQLTFGPGGPGGPGRPWKTTPENNTVGLLIISTTLTSTEVKIYMKYTFQQQPSLPHSLWVLEGRVDPANRRVREGPVTGTHTERVNKSVKHAF